MSSFSEILMNFKGKPENRAGNSQKIAIFKNTKKPIIRAEPGKD
jgi:hypothetical protein